MSNKILLVGCGQIGSRHLQAIACLSSVSEVHVVDVNVESIALAQARLKEVRDINPQIRFFWHSQLNSAVSQGSLCILATQAKGRRDLIRNIATHHGYRKFLVEKIVTQSMQEYEQLLDDVALMNLSLWVHCQTRLYPVHQYIKSKLNPQEPLFFSEVGGNWGLVCNGIHYADLFLFYDQGEAFIPVSESIDPILHPSKRGKDIFDLSGVMVAKTSKGSQFILNYASSHNQPDIVFIMNSQQRFMVDVITGVAFESYKNETWRPLNMTGSIFVSQTSKTIIEDILLNKNCGLPTLEECRASHEYILGQLQPYFNQLLKQELAYCPTT